MIHFPLYFCAKIFKNTPNNCFCLVAIGVIERIGITSSTCKVSIPLLVKFPTIVSSSSLFKHISIDNVFHTFIVLINVDAFLFVVRYPMLSIPNGNVP